MLSLDFRLDLQQMAHILDTMEEAHHFQIQNSEFRICKQLEKAQSVMYLVDQTTQQYMSMVKMHQQHI